MNTKPTNTYSAGQKRVRRQINTLNALLDAHAKKHARRPRDTGFDGDLGHVTTILNEAIEFLGGTGEKIR